MTPETEMSAAMERLRADEAAIFKAQDEALEAVRARCDEERKRHPGASNA